MSLNRNIIEREIKISAEKAKLKELEERAYIQREAVLNGERHFRQLQTLQSGIEDNLNWTIINVRSEIDNLETAQGMLIEDGIKIFKGREAKEAVLQQEIIRLKGELTKATGAMLMSGESLSPEKTGEHEKEIRDLEMRLDEMVSSWSNPSLNQTNSPLVFRKPTKRPTTRSSFFRRSGPTPNSRTVASFWPER